MFDISFWELAVIGVVALVVIGPEKLPGIARTAGVWLGKAQRMVASVKADINRELQTDELKKLLTEQKAEMQELRKVIDDSRTDLEADIKKVSADLNIDHTAAKPSEPQNPAVTLPPSSTQQTGGESPAPSPHGDIR